VNTMNHLLHSWESTGLYLLFKQTQQEGVSALGPLLMIAVGLLLLYLAIRKQFEPLLLVPIGFGTILSNIPGAGFNDAPTQAAAGGLLYYIYEVGVNTGGIFPLGIFMGVGALTDFGPLLANPKMLFLGAAAQFGIFAPLLGAVYLSQAGLFDFTLQDASAIGIIGGADGATAICVARRRAPVLLGAIAVAAYSYVALVPIIEPPIMRALTTEAARKIKMEQLRHVSRTERIFFPLVLLLWVAFFLPPAAPLL